MEYAEFDLYFLNQDIKRKKKTTLLCWTQLLDITAISKVKLGKSIAISYAR